jgi:hypothetical protein
MTPSVTELLETSTIAMGAPWERVMLTIGSFAVMTCLFSIGRKSPDIVPGPPWAIPFKFAGGYAIVCVLSGLLLAMVGPATLLALATDARPCTVPPRHVLERAYMDPDDPEISAARKRFALCVEWENWTTYFLNIAGVSMTYSAGAWLALAKRPRAK